MNDEQGFVVTAHCADGQPLGHLHYNDNSTRADENIMLMVGHYETPVFTLIHRSWPDGETVKTITLAWRAGGWAIDTIKVTGKGAVGIEL